MGGSRPCLPAACAMSQSIWHVIVCAASARHWLRPWFVAIVASSRGDIVRIPEIWFGPDHAIF